MANIPFHNVQGWILVSICCVCLKGHLNGFSRKLKARSSSYISFIWELVRNAKPQAPGQAFLNQNLKM